MKKLNLKSIGIPDAEILHYRCLIWSAMYGNSPCCSEASFCSTESTANPIDMKSLELEYYKVYNVDRSKIILV